jgi:hypothetical protein
MQILFAPQAEHQNQKV